MNSHGGHACRSPAEVLARSLDGIELGTAWAEGETTCVLLTLRGATTRRAVAVPLALALATGQAEARELDRPRIDALVLRNRSARSEVVALAGEMLRGGRQDRALCSTVLLSPQAAARVDVCCVERRRWSGARRFASTSGLAHSSVRTQLSATSDQQEVWNEIARLARQRGVSDIDSSLAVVQTIVPATTSAGVADGLGGEWSGIAQLRDGRVTNLDLFGAREHFAHYRASLIAAVAGDRPATAGTPAPEPAPTRPADRAGAQELLRRLASASWVSEATGPGHGAHLRACTDGLVCSALIVDQELVHLQVAPEARRPGLVRVAPGAQGDAARLELHLPGAAPTELRLESGRWLVGRHPDCEIQVLDRQVSRQHAWLCLGPGGCSIQDAGSANGTEVNGESVAFARLQVGDEIRLGVAALVRCLALP